MRNSSPTAPPGHNTATSDTRKAERSRSAFRFAPRNRNNQIVLLLSRQPNPSSRRHLLWSNLIRNRAIDRLSCHHLSESPLDSPHQSEYTASPAFDSHLAHNTHTCSHSVEFYDDHAAFLDELAVFVRSALEAGGASLIIATEASRQGLAQRLRASGVDLMRAVQNSQYLLLDAKATLARFMIDGWPDPQAFFAAIEPHLMYAKASLGPDAKFPVAFGEMVALLWNEGQRDAAIRLEQLWNDLAHKHSFSLLCAYSRDSFTPEADRDYIRRICAEHSHVLGI